MRRRPVGRLGPVLGALGAVGAVAAAAAWQLSSQVDPASSRQLLQDAPPVSACSWSERRFQPEEPGRYTYRATCDGAGALQASITGGTTLTGQVGDLALELELDPLSDAASFDTTWNGRLGEAAVLLVVQQWEMTAQSRVGDGQLRCPAPPVLAGDWSWLEEDPTVVAVAFTGDPRISTQQAGALCNLMTTALPASSFGFAKGEAGVPQ